MVQSTLIRSFLSLVTPALLAAALPAQLTKMDELVLAPNDSARSVDVEWPYAWVATFGDGIQHQVDLSVPLQLGYLGNFNPAWGDQWGESIVRTGRLVCGHRFGGLNLWDVAGTPFQLDSVSTAYHFDGLAQLDYQGQDLLFYSEANTTNGQAGLIVYDLGAGQLNPIGQSMAGNALRDGRFLTVTNDGWVYQLDGGAGSTRPLMLNVYDAAVPSNPTFSQQFDMGCAVGSYIGNTDLQLHPAQNILYAACGYDGLRVLDIQNRPNPVLLNTLGAPGVAVKELDWGEGTSYMLVTVRLPNNESRFLILNCANPVNPVMVGNLMGDPGFTIHDIIGLAHATGPIVLVAGSDVNGDAVLQLWM